MGDSITISISGGINMSTDGDADLFSLDDQHRSDSDWDSQSLTESDIDAELELQDQDEVNIFTILEAFEGPAQNHDGHGSPGNDEVEDSDDQQTSEDEDSEGQDEDSEGQEEEDEDSEGQDEDSEGQEEEDEEINVEDDGEGNAQPSSVTMPAEPRSPPSPPQPQAVSPAHHLHPATLRHVGESEFMTSGHSQHAAPSSSSPSPAHHRHPATLRHVGESEFMTSGHSQHAAPSSSSPSRHTNSSPAAGSWVWQYEPSPGPSSLSHTHNSSMDDIQAPLMGGLSVLSSLAAAQSSQSLTENFSPCKRRRIMSPVKASDLRDRKSSPRAHQPPRMTMMGMSVQPRCSICYESWDNSGRHRLASLKCGHLFGLGCIEKWLKGHGRKCPSCNQKAKVKHIRVIYAKAIKERSKDQSLFPAAIKSTGTNGGASAVESTAQCQPSAPKIVPVNDRVTNMEMGDTTEHDRALDELGREREMRLQAELEAAQARLQCQQYMEESGRLRAQVAMLREQATSRSGKGEGLSQSQASRSVASNSQELQGQFVHHQTVRLCESGQCHVLAHCPSMAVLVISQPSPNNLFPGFGIKKTSEDEDSEGQEEEDEEINVEDDGEGNAQPSSVTMPAEPRSPPSPPQPQAVSPAHHLHPATLRHVGESEFMTSGHSQHAAPSSSSPSPAHHRHPVTLRHVGESEFMTSGHSQHAAPSSSSPSRHTNSSPAAGSWVWQYEPSPGPSSLSHTHNSSMDDIQVPLMGGLSVLSSLAAARSSQSLTENFQPCKRRRIMSPVKASDLRDRKSSPQGTAAVQNDEHDDDGNRCSICYESWDNSGRHRLASLKCGHLFGLWCIEKWLKGHGRKCPSCNQKAKVKHIRVIYAKAIKMGDNTEHDRALDELGREREMRRQAELEAAQARLQCQQYTEESGRLRALVALLREQLATSRSRSGDWGSALSRMLPLHLSLQLASLYTFP